MRSGPGEPGPGDLATKHGQLETEDEDLGFLCPGTGPVDANDVEDALDEAVEER